MDHKIKIEIKITSCLYVLVIISMYTKSLSHRIRIEQGKTVFWPLNTSNYCNVIGDVKNMWLHDFKFTSQILLDYHWITVGVLQWNRFW